MTETIKIEVSEIEMEFLISALLFCELKINTTTYEELRLKIEKQWKEQSDKFK